MSEPQPEPLDPPAGLSADGSWEMDTDDGPCRTWPLLDDGCGCLPEDPAEFDAQQRYAVEVATEILWRLTAGRFGVCRELIRPCRKSAKPADGGRFSRGMQPDIIDGQWVNIGCGCRSFPRRDECGCGIGPDRVNLPGPVVWDRPGYATPNQEPYRYALMVWEDGELLEEGVDYTLYPRGALFRAHGVSWPTSQDLMAPYDAPGAFSVLYWRGVRVPVAGRRAVTALACQIYKKCVGDGSCELPERVTQVNRDGLTFTMIDPMRFLDQGRTGLADVDLWLAAVNPRGNLQPSLVWSPDLPTHRPEHTGSAPWLPPYPAGGAP